MARIAALRAPARRPYDAGYTLIELVVVIVVIGILAAIAVPFFVSQQSQAHNAAARSDLAIIRLAMVSYSVEHGGRYTSDTDALDRYGFATSTAAAPRILVSQERFCVEVTADSSAQFYVTDLASARSGTCATSGDPAFAVGRPGGGNRVPRT